MCWSCFLGTARSCEEGLTKAAQHSTSPLSLHLQKNKFEDRLLVRIKMHPCASNFAGVACKKQHPPWRPPVSERHACWLHASFSIEPAHRPVPLFLHSTSGLLGPCTCGGLGPC